MTNSQSPVKPAPVKKPLPDGSSLQKVVKRIQVPKPGKPQQPKEKP